MAASDPVPVPPFRFSLDLRSGVPVYRQLIDQVLVAISAGSLQPGGRLPTVRQVAVDLSINPNTVMRAYKEMEIRGILSTQQGTGTFITSHPVERDQLARERRAAQLVSEMVARAGAEGLSVPELKSAFDEMFSQGEKKES